MNKITEQPSHYRHLEQMTISELLTNINKEDLLVPFAVQKAIPQIEKLVEKAVQQLKIGGRLFYIGAGTSGRLGVLDASELPPTFGVDSGLVIGVIAGGSYALQHAVEFAEDSHEQAWIDLQKYHISSKDMVIGIAASGTTPYVVHGLKTCQANNIATGCITCNPDAPIAEYSDFPIEVIVGPEFVTGSSRMKAGTAQKLVLNMISTSLMIQMGKVKDNKMVDMQLSNNKLIDRGTKIIAETLKIDYAEAEKLLQKEQSVRKAIERYIMK